MGERFFTSPLGVSGGSGSVSQTRAFPPPEQLVGDAFHKRKQKLSLGGKKVYFFESVLQANR